MLVLLWDYRGGEGNYGYLTELYKYSDIRSVLLNKALITFILASPARLFTAQTIHNNNTYRCIRSDFWYRQHSCAGISWAGVSLACVSPNWPATLFLLHGYIYTICPRSSDPFYVVAYSIEWGHHFLDIQYIEINLCFAYNQNECVSNQCRTCVYNIHLKLCKFCQEFHSI